MKDVYHYLHGRDDQFDVNVKLVHCSERDIRWYTPVELEAGVHAEMDRVRRSQVSIRARTREAGIANLQQITSSGNLEPVRNRNSHSDEVYQPRRSTRARIELPTSPDNQDGDDSEVSEYEG